MSVKLNMQIRNREILILKDNMPSVLSVVLIRTVNR